VQHPGTGAQLPRRGGRRRPHDDGPGLRQPRTVRRRLWRVRTRLRRNRRGGNPLRSTARQRTDAGEQDQPGKTNPCGGASHQFAPPSFLPGTMSSRTNSLRFK
jgi:hypothetical protein